MEDHNENKESPCLQYWDGNNIYEWTMSQKLPVNNFEQIEYTPQFDEDFTKNYNEESDEGFFLEVDVQYNEKVHELHNDLQFSPGRMKIEKVEKLGTDLCYKNKYVIHIKNLK